MILFCRPVVPNRCGIQRFLVGSISHIKYIFTPPGAMQFAVASSRLSTVYTPIISFNVIGGSILRVG